MTFEEELNQKARIIMTRSWYDPEGLNIPDKNAKVIMEGTLDACDDYLSNLLLADLGDKYSDRNDISVELKETDKFGKNKLSFTIGLIEVYFSSAISKNYYRIVPAE